MFVLCCQQSANAQNDIVDLTCKSFGWLPQPDVKVCLINDIIATNKTFFRFSLNTVETLIATNCSLITIPNGLFSNFVMLKHMSFVSAGIETLTADDFIAATHLYTIAMSNNSIEALGNNTFSAASELHQVDLSYNKISTIDSSTFEYLNRLEVILLNNNRISVFACRFSSSAIKELQLQMNRIHTFQPILVAGTRLTELSLAQNLLTTLNDTLDAEYWSHITKLDIAVNNPLLTLISGNKPFESTEFLNISHSTYSTCYISATLTILDASHNRIDSVCVQDANSSVLEELSLSKNQLTSMTNLTQLKYLRKLDLSFNNITDLNHNSFAHMIQLEMLYLESTGLQRLDYGMFSHLQSMRVLDLSYNRLRTIDLKLLLFMHEMKELFFEGNDLTSLDYESIPKQFPVLRFLGLADNQFNCSYLMDLLRCLSLSDIELKPSDSSSVRTKSPNIFGIQCHINSTTTTSYSPMAPTQHQTEHAGAFKAIETKINAIVSDVTAMKTPSSSDLMTKRKFQTDISTLQDDLERFNATMNDRLFDQKLDIVSSVSRLYSGSDNRTDEYLNLKFRIDENRQINLERFHALSERLDRMVAEVNNWRQQAPSSATKTLMLTGGGQELGKTNISSWLLAVLGTVLTISIAICMAVALVLCRNKCVQPARRSASSATIHTLI